jgi:hypothetical protein
MTTRDFFNKDIFIADDDNTGEEKVSVVTYKTICGYAALTRLILNECAKKGSSYTFKDFIYEKCRDIPSQILLRVSEQLAVNEYMTTLNLSDLYLVPFDFNRFDPLYYCLVPKFGSNYYTVFDSLNNSDKGYERLYNVSAVPNLTNNDFGLLRKIENFGDEYERTKNDLKKFSDATIDEVIFEGFGIPNGDKNIIMTFKKIYEINNKKTVGVYAEMEAENSKKYSSLMSGAEDETISDEFPAPSPNECKKIVDELINATRRSEELKAHSLSSDMEKLCSNLGRSRGVLNYIYNITRKAANDGITMYKDPRIKRTKK